MREVSKLMPAQQQSAIEYARGLLKRCEAGEVITVTAIEEHPNRTYVVQGNGTPSRHETAGMLLEAAMTRILDED